MSFMLQPVCSTHPLCTWHVSLWKNSMCRGFTMEVLQAIKERHSVRQFKDQIIPTDIAQKLEALIQDNN